MRTRRRKAAANQANIRERWARALKRQHDDVTLELRRVFLPGQLPKRQPE